jgi:choline monooxygenase
LRLTVGRTEQVKSPGQYFTGELMGEPYVVVRDQEGQLRAFFNVCRHHASKVATVRASVLLDTCERRE